MKNRRVNGSHEALIVLSSDNVAGMESVRPTGHGLCHWLSPTTLKPVNNHPISKKNWPPPIFMLSGKTERNSAAPMTEWNSMGLILNYQVRSVIQNYQAPMTDWNMANVVLRSRKGYKSYETYVVSCKIVAWHKAEVWPLRLLLLPTQQCANVYPMV
jgi:hypothetical protein